jgi:hypothetical protein
MNEAAKTDSVQSAQFRVSHPEAGNVLGRGLKLSLDGKEWAYLRAGQAISTEIAPGHHRLRADNTYQKKTIEFDVQPGEQVHYRIGNRVGFFGSMMVAVLGAGPMYLVIERADPAE